MDATLMSSSWEKTWDTDFPRRGARLGKLQDERGELLAGLAKDRFYCSRWNDRNALQRKARRPCAKPWCRGNAAVDPANSTLRNPSLRLDPTAKLPLHHRNDDRSCGTPSKNGQGRGPGHRRHLRDRPHGRNGLSYGPSLALPAAGSLHGCHAPFRLPRYRLKPQPGAGVHCGLLGTGMGTGRDGPGNRPSRPVPMPVPRRHGDRA